ncbi:dihydrolipoamide acetyltransferase family protein [Microbulbifer sp. GL-2]|uniref:dihydrolipoamide acetyltransferase family protein n=1 Tax=Microbulbifer sp. GL-2 TaxID=2591606 RepID=UPI0011629F3C|nr:dihydrolipoamide acetyltransferase family protein [Microbulbifer sp. GL-2]BBM01332.1 dihydrolipoamide acetyltransferase component of pyruvate dehydrogenase complex [Microbulbifer sp. GL-2]
MKIFTLPDLGEGLPDAVVREWHISEGDSIVAHESLVTVETAKALVEVPAPWGGKIEKLFAAEDETVNVGEPLVGFAAEGETAGAEEVPSPSPEVTQSGIQEPPQAVEEHSSSRDSGTVVGKLEQGQGVLGAEQGISEGPSRLATPSVRALARRLGVDLQRLSENGALVTEAQVRSAADSMPKTAGKPNATAPCTSPASPFSSSTQRTDSQVIMSPARRAMGLSMSRARDQVAQITLCDDADISTWWGSEPALLRLIRAVQTACLTEPTLNALYQEDRLAPQQSVNIGLAVDSPRGLFVPVLRNVVKRSDKELMQQVADYKHQARETGIAQSDLQGATILLSNFGAIAGRYATPVVLPPTVAIIGAGRVCQGVVVVDRWPAMRPLLPLSISADHRAVTGGELARFLQAMLQALSS